MKNKNFRAHKKVSSEIVEIQQNPTRSPDTPKDSRKRKILQAAGAVMLVSAIDYLNPGNAFAGEDWKGFALRFKDKLPNGFKKDLCQEQRLGLAYLYMMNGGRDYGLMRTLLVNQRARSVYSEHVDKSTWFCDTGAYNVASATYFWKYPQSDGFGLDSSVYKEMETNFYHNYALMKGITHFYIEHVIYKNKKKDTEKWLVESIFACAEEYPKHGVNKAQEYLSGNYETRVQLISDLRKKFNSMSYSNSDKLDRDISGKAGKGPLNNWYRLLSAQWGAFFLANHYISIKNEELGLTINENIEIPLRKIGKLRGPPNYYS